MSLGDETPPRRIDLAEGASLASMTEVMAVNIGSALATIEPWVRYPISATAVTAFLAADEPGATRLAILDSAAAPVGALGLRTNWLRGPYVQFLGLLPEAQGTRLGSHVLDWVEQDARRAGHRNAWVCASSFNARALRFYERRGYVRVATLDSLLADGFDEILLRLRLS